jgi:hypothetical protein
MAAKRSRCREEILMRQAQLKQTKQVELPAGMTLDAAVPLVNFVQSLRYDNITYGASESFTRILAADPTIFVRFGKFVTCVVDRVVAFNEEFGNRNKITVGSWKQLAATVPPSSVPHFYLLCHLLRTIATTIHESTLHHNVAESCLQSQCKELCYHAWELERCVESENTWSGFAAQIKPIMRAINFAKAEKLHLLTPAAAAAAFEERKENELGDDLVGLVWLYSAFMFSCGRFKPQHQLSFGFANEELRQQIASVLGLDDVDFENASPLESNVYMAYLDHDRKISLPAACLYIQYDDDPVKSLAFGFGGALDLSVDLHND